MKNCLIEFCFAKDLGRRLKLKTNSTFNMRYDFKHRSHDFNIFLVFFLFFLLFFCFFIMIIILLFLIFFLFFSLFYVYFLQYFSSFFILGLVSLKTYFAELNNSFLINVSHPPSFCFTIFLVFSEFCFHKFVNINIFRKIFKFSVFSIDFKS